MRTNVEHVYAIGDVTAKLMLAHVAEAQGVVAAETLAGAETQELEYVMMPRATFCQPQVASFGYTQAQAEELADEKGWKVKVAQFPFTANGKAQGMAEPNGFVKLISDDTYGELLGGHIIGAGGDRAAAGADAGPEVGPDGVRAGAQRARAPDPVRGTAGGDPRPGRPHDQPLSGPQSRERGLLVGAARLAADGVQCRLDGGLDGRGRDVGVDPACGGQRAGRDRDADHGELRVRGGTPG